MKRCKKCGFNALSLDTICDRCGAPLAGIPNIATENCAKCGHHKSKRVDNNSPALCFYCYHNDRARSFYRSTADDKHTTAEEYMRLALVKMNEAHYYRDDLMLSKTNRLYQLAGDMQSQINEELRVEMQALAQELINY
jgi:predicted  nucleic acid-binding Zn-ribbon protein